MARKVERLEQEKKWDESALHRLQQRYDLQVKLQNGEYAYYQEEIEDLKAEISRLKARHESGSDSFDYDGLAGREAQSASQLSLMQLDMDSLRRENQQMQQEKEELAKRVSWLRTVFETIDDWGSKGQARPLTTTERIDAETTAVEACQKLMLASIETEQTLPLSEKLDSSLSDKLESTNMAPGPQTESSKGITEQERPTGVEESLPSIESQGASTLLASEDSADSGPTYRPNFESLCRPRQMTYYLQVDSDPVLGITQIMNPRSSLVLTPGLRERPYFELQLTGRSGSTAWTRIYLGTQVRCRYAVETFRYALAAESSETPSEVLEQWPAYSRTEVICLKFALHFRDIVHLGTAFQEGLDSDSKASIKKLMDQNKSLNLSVWFLPPFEAINFIRVCLRPMHNFVHCQRLDTHDGWQSVDGIYHSEWFSDPGKVAKKAQKHARFRPNQHPQARDPETKPSRGSGTNTTKNRKQEWRHRQNWRQPRQDHVLPTLDSPEQSPSVSKTETDDVFEDEAITEAELNTTQEAIDQLEIDPLDSVQEV